MKKVTEQISSGSIVTAAIEINEQWQRISAGVGDQVLNASIKQVGVEDIRRVIN